nr:uncharacterized protein LOC108020829 [Drosophila suzukii]
MAARFFIVFSAIIVLAQGSNILPIEEESEVAVHSGVPLSGAPVAIVSQGHQSVPQPIGSAYGHGPLQVPLGGAHRGNRIRIGRTSCLRGCSSSCCVHCSSCRRGRARRCGCPSGSHSPASWSGCPCSRGSRSWKCEPWSPPRIETPPRR